jgi:hypothetical protein
MQTSFPEFRTLSRQGQAQPYRLPAEVGGGRFAGVGLARTKVRIEVVPRGVWRQRGEHEPSAAVVQCGVEVQPRAVPARLQAGQVAKRGGSQQALGHDLGGGTGRQRRVEPPEGEELGPEQGALEVLAQLLCEPGEERLVVRPSTPHRA